MTDKNTLHEVDLARWMGIAIKNLRYYKGMNQTELAQQVGVTQAYISKIEKGAETQRVHLNILAKIAEALGEKLSTLIAQAEDYPNWVRENFGPTAKETLIDDPGAIISPEHRKKTRKKQRKLVAHP